MFDAQINGMKISFVIFALLGSAIFSGKLSAQNNVTAEKDSSNIKTEFFAYPFAFYTPEKKFSFGGGGILSLKDTTRKNSKPSKLVFSTYYSTAHQYLVYLNPEFYLENEKYLLTGFFWVEKLVEKFYGYGSNSEDIEEPFYKLFDFTVNLTANYAVSKKFLVGILYNYIFVSRIDALDNPVLKSGEVIGADGGALSGTGMRFLYDSRDNIFYPSEGFYNEIQMAFYAKALGGRYDYNSFLLDFRKYIGITENQVLALETYFNAVYGTPPFYSYPKLGGYRRMRGYYEGRFRDRNYYSLQAELRSLVYWRFYGVVFFGAGDVSNKLVNFKMKNMKFSYGFGLRFRLDTKEKIDLRLDIGFGKNTSGFYFQVEEAF